MDLGDVDRITADAVGEPGMRTFFLQARAAGELVSVIVEKQQVQLLAASVFELLEDEEVDLEEGVEDDLDLEQPVDPRWRAGRLSLGYDRDDDRFLLEITEFTPELEDEDETDERSLVEGEAEVLRLWVSRPQMLALARHGAEVADRGRPTCQLCGNPMDPEGHVCPATNGHRTPQA